MKHLFCGLFVALIALPILTQAQTSENFDEVTVDGSGISLSTSNPRIISNWSLGLIDNAGTYLPSASNFLDITNHMFAQGGSDMANGGSDKVLHVTGAYQDAKSFVLKSANTAPSNFSLQSFNFDGTGVPMIAMGFRGGTQVVSQDFSPAPNTPLLIMLTDPLWHNIDEFRIEQKDGTADLVFFLDDIDVATALPVTLNTFRAELIHKDVKLQWQMGIKNDIQSFIMQRSKDGINFLDIAQIALDASPDGLHYFYIDPAAPLGMDYYRLKLVSINHNADDYSQIISIHNGNAAKNWQLYPNPVGSSLEILSQETLTAPAKAVIFASNGTKVGSFELSGGQHSWHLTLPGMASGLYYLQISQKGQAVTELKMVKK